MRPLLSEEQAFLRRYFGDALGAPMGGFRIALRRFGDTKRALSLNGGFMSFPRDYFLDRDPARPLNCRHPAIGSVFAHEVLHQLQRRNGCWVTVNATVLQLLYAMKLYDPYAYRPLADPVAMLALFRRANCERQGQMFQDYVRKAIAGEADDAYRLIADYVKNACKEGGTGART